jgi:hypothetical protein
MSASPQSGLRVPEGAFRPQRTEFVPENYVGYTPSDPAWEPISDGIRSFNPGYGHELSEDAYLGNADYRRRVQSESHEPELTYAQQNWLYDSNGDYQNLISYGMAREGNLMPDSVTLVRRQDASVGQQSVTPASTVDARYNPSAARDGADSTAKGIHVYDVLKGMYVNEGVIVAENGESTVNNEVTGLAQRGRMYQVDQPPATTTIAIQSTDSRDTGKQVVIENDGAGTAETVSLDGTDATTTVATTATFDSLDAIEVQDESTGLTVDGERSTFYGDIVIGIDEGDPSATGYTPTMGEWLAVLFGEDAHAGSRPNEGVPPLGSGSHAGLIAPSNPPEFYVPEDMGVQRPVGDNVSTSVGVVQTMELSIENNLEQIETGNREMTALPGMRDIEFTISLTGETVTPHLQTIAVIEENETTRVLFGSTGNEYVDLFDSPLEESDAEDEGGEPVTEREATFRPQIASDGGPAIDISTASS